MARQPSGPACVAAASSAGGTGPPTDGVHTPWRVAVLSEVPESPEETWEGTPAAAAAANQSHGSRAAAPPVAVEKPPKGKRPPPSEPPSSAASTAATSRPTAMRIRLSGRLLSLLRDIQELSCCATSSPDFDSSRQATLLQLIQEELYHIQEKHRVAAWRPPLAAAAGSSAAAVISRSTRAAAKEQVLLQDPAQQQTSVYSGDAATGPRMEAEKDGDSFEQLGWMPLVLQLHLTCARLLQPPPIEEEEHKQQQQRQRPASAAAQTRLRVQTNEFEVSSFWQLLQHAGCSAAAAATSGGHAPPPTASAEARFCAPAAPPTVAAPLGPWLLSKSFCRSYSTEGDETASLAAPRMSQESDTAAAAEGGREGTFFEVREARDEVLPFDVEFEFCRGCWTSICREQQVKQLRQLRLQQQRQQLIATFLHSRPSSRRSMGNSSISSAGANSGGTSTSTGVAPATAKGSSSAAQTTAAPSSAGPSFLYVSPAHQPPSGSRDTTTTGATASHSSTSSPSTGSSSGSTSGQSRGDAAAAVGAEPITSRLSDCSGSLCAFCSPALPSLVRFTLLQQSTAADGEAAATTAEIGPPREAQGTRACGPREAVRPAKEEIEAAPATKAAGRQQRQRRLRVTLRIDSEVLHFCCCSGGRFEAYFLALLAHMLDVGCDGALEAWKRLREVRLHSGERSLELQQQQGAEHEKKQKCCKGKTFEKRSEAGMHAETARGQRTATAAAWAQQLAAGELHARMEEEAGAAAAAEEKEDEEEEQLREQTKAFRAWLRIPTLLLRSTAMARQRAHHAMRVMLDCSSSNSSSGTAAEAAAASGLSGAMLAAAAAATSAGGELPGSFIRDDMAPSIPTEAAETRADSCLDRCPEEGSTGSTGSTEAWWRTAESSHSSGGGGYAFDGEGICAQPMTREKYDWHVTLLTSANVNALRDSLGDLALDVWHTCFFAHDSWNRARIEAAAAARAAAAAAARATVRAAAAGETAPDDKRGNPSPAVGSSQVNGVARQLDTDAGTAQASRQWLRSASAAAPLPPWNRGGRSTEGWSRGSIAERGDSSALGRAWSSRERLEQLLVALLGNKDAFVRLEAVKLLNAFYDRHDWQLRHPFTPLIKCVGDRFVLHVLIEVARRRQRGKQTPQQQQRQEGEEARPPPPTEIMVILVAPTFSRHAAAEVYSYHDFSWMLLQTLPGRGDAAITLTESSQSSTIPTRCSEHSNSSSSPEGSSVTSGCGGGEAAEEAAAPLHQLQQQQQRHQQEQQQQSRQAHVGQQASVSSTWRGRKGEEEDGVAALPSSSSREQLQHPLNTACRRRATVPEAPAAAAATAEGFAETEDDSDSSEWVRERWLGCADFGVFTRSGFYDWRICRAVEHYGSWLTVERVLCSSSSSNQGTEKEPFSPSLVSEEYAAPIPAAAAAVLSAPLMPCCASGSYNARSPCRATGSSPAAAAAATAAAASRPKEEAKAHAEVAAATGAAQEAGPRGGRDKSNASAAAVAASLLRCRCIEQAAAAAAVAAALDAAAPASVDELLHQQQQLQEQQQELQQPQSLTQQRLQQPLVPPHANRLRAHCVPLQGRVVVLSKAARSLQMHEVFVDAHEAVWNEDTGEVLQRGNFATVAESFETLVETGVNAAVVQGALERDCGDVYYNVDGEFDYANADATPFASICRATPCSLLGGVGGFVELMQEARRVGMKVMVEMSTSVSAAHPLRRYRPLMLHYEDAAGRRELFYGGDNRGIVADEMALLNFRKLETWQLFIEEVKAWLKKFGIDGIRITNAHEAPHLLAADTAALSRKDADGQYHYAAEDILLGEVVLPHSSSSTGYWDLAYLKMHTDSPSASLRSISSHPSSSPFLLTYANPFFVKLCRSLWLESPEFLVVGECWTQLQQQQQLQQLIGRTGSGKALAASLAIAASDPAVVPGLLAASGVIPQMPLLPSVLPGILNKPLPWIPFSPLTPGLLSLPLAPPAAAASTATCLSLQRRQTMTHLQRQQQQRQQFEQLQLQQLRQPLPPLLVQAPPPWCLFTALLALQQKLPRGAFVIQASCTPASPLPALVYGEAAWAATDLHMFLSAAACTSAGEIHGSAYRLGVPNFFPSESAACSSVGLTLDGEDIITGAASSSLLLGTSLGVQNLKKQQRTAAGPLLLRGGGGGGPAAPASGSSSSWHVRQWSAAYGEAMGRMEAVGGDAERCSGGSAAAAAASQTPQRLLAIPQRREEAGRQLFFRRNRTTALLAARLNALSLVASGGGGVPPADGRVAAAVAEAAAAANKRLHDSSTDSNTFNSNTGLPLLQRIRTLDGFESITRLPELERQLQEHLLQRAAAVPEPSSSNNSSSGAGHASVRGSEGCFDLKRMQQHYTQRRLLRQRERCLQRGRVLVVDLLNPDGTSLTQSHQVYAEWPAARHDLGCPTPATSLAAAACRALLRPGGEGGDAAAGCATENCALMASFVGDLLFSGGSSSSRSSVNASREEETSTAEDEEDTADEEEDEAVGMQSVNMEVLQEEGAAAAHGGGAALGGGSSSELLPQVGGGVASSGGAGGGGAAAAAEDAAEKVVAFVRFDDELLQQQMRRVIACSSSNSSSSHGPPPSPAGWWDCSGRRSSSSWTGNSRTSWADSRPSDSSSNSSSNSSSGSASIADGLWLKRSGSLTETYPSDCCGALTSPAAAASDRVARQTEHCREEQAAAAGHRPGAAGAAEAAGEWRAAADPTLLQTEGSRFLNYWRRWRSGDRGGDAAAGGLVEKTSMRDLHAIVLVVTNLGGTVLHDKAVSLRNLRSVFRQHNVPLWHFVLQSCDLQECLCEENLRTFLAAGSSAEAAAAAGALQQWQKQEQREGWANSKKQQQQGGSSASFSSLLEMGSEQPHQSGEEDMAAAAAAGGEEGEGGVASFAGHTVLPDVISLEEFLSEPLLLPPLPPYASYIRGYRLLPLLLLCPPAPSHLPPAAALCGGRQQHKDEEREDMPRAQQLMKSSSSKPRLLLRSLYPSLFCCSLLRLQGLLRRLRHRVSTSSGSREAAAAAAATNPHIGMSAAALRRCRPHTRGNMILQLLTEIAGTRLHHQHGRLGPAAAKAAQFAAAATAELDLLADYLDQLGTALEFRKQLLQLQRRRSLVVGDSCSTSAVPPQPQQDGGEDDMQQPSAALSLFSICSDSQLFNDREDLACSFMARLKCIAAGGQSSSVEKEAAASGIETGGAAAAAASPSPHSSHVVCLATEVLESNTLGAICFVTPELGKWSTVGGLGVMVDELSSTLATEFGQEIWVVSPYYDRNRKGEQDYLARDGVSYAFNITVNVGGESITFGVHTGSVVPGVKLFFLHNTSVFPHCYPEVYGLAAVRFISAFAKGALELFCYLRSIPSLIVTNDWPTALIPAYAKLRFFGNAFNSTTFYHIIHNLDPHYEGRIYLSKREDVCWLHGLPTELLVDPLWHSYVINPSRCVLLECDGWGTVSPSYRDELIAEKSTGSACSPSPLAPLLRRHLHPFAVPNGIPVKARLQRLKSLGFRSHWEAKAALQRQYFHFEHGDESIPLLAFIGRITSQKGVHLIVDVAESLIRRHEGRVQILVGGQANWKDGYASRCASRLLALRANYPFSLWAEPSEFFSDGALVNLGADFGLMPSMFEPGGIVQHEFFIAGTPVIAFRTGGLKDTVHEGGAGLAAAVHGGGGNPGSGGAGGGAAAAARRTAAAASLSKQNAIEAARQNNGFTFESYTTGDFLFAIERALRVFNDREKYEHLRRNARLSVVSCEESARAWLEEFARLRKKIPVNGKKVNELFRQLPRWSEAEWLVRRQRAAEVYVHRERQLLLRQQLLVQQLDEEDEEQAYAVGGGGKKHSFLDTAGGAAAADMQAMLGVEAELACLKSSALAASPSTVLELLQRRDVQQLRSLQRQRFRRIAGLLQHHIPHIKAGEEQEEQQEQAEAAARAAAARAAGCASSSAAGDPSEESERGGGKAANKAPSGREGLLLLSNGAKNSHCSFSADGDAAAAAAAAAVGASPPGGALLLHPGAAGSRGASNLEIIKSSRSSKAERSRALPCRIQFVPTPGKPRPRSVAVAGNFDDWRLRRPLAWDNALQAFTISLALPPGVYCYKLVVDGEWMCIPEAPKQRDARGNENNVIRVK